MGIDDATTNRVTATPEEVGVVKLSPAKEDLIKNHLTAPIKLLGETVLTANPYRNNVPVTSDGRYRNTLMEGAYEKGKRDQDAHTRSEIAKVLKAIMAQKVLMHHDFDHLIAELEGK